MNTNRLHINNDRFTVRFVTVAKAMGLKTVGQMRAMVEKANPNCKIQGVRVHILRRELDHFTKVASS